MPSTHFVAPSVNVSTFSQVNDTLDRHSVCRSVPRKARSTSVLKCRRKTLFPVHPHTAETLLVLRRLPVLGTVLTSGRQRYGGKVCYCVVDDAIDVLPLLLDATLS